MGKLLMEFTSAWSTSLKAGIVGQSWVGCPRTSQILQDSSTRFCFGISTFLLSRASTFLAN
ncbi:hypothetical protein LguiA_004836 [Lonicera macranthoides]